MDATLQTKINGLEKYSVVRATLAQYLPIGLRFCCRVF